jgi:hypothetical protein
MSLDNVLAIAAAAGGETQLIILGLIISIPLVVFGAGVLTWILDRLPILVWAGSALLGWVAGELIATEPVLQSYVLAIAQTFGVSVKFVARTIETAGAVRRAGWMAHSEGRPCAAGGGAACGIACQFARHAGGRPFCAQPSHTLGGPLGEVRGTTSRT